MITSSSSPSLRTVSWTRNFWWILSIVAAVVVTYAAAPSFDFTNYDDDIFVVGNQRLEGGLTIKNIQWAFAANLTEASRQAEYWQPVTTLSRLLDVSLFGRNPAGHHLQSLLLHALNACLIFLLARRLGATEWLGGSMALIFAVHPLNVEVVCWMAARKDLLCGLGSLLTLLAYVRFVRQPSVGRLALALAAYSFALMAKPSAIALPIAFLLLDAWPLARFGHSWVDFRRRGSRSNLSVLFEKIPFGMLSILVAALTYFSQKETGGVLPTAKPFLMRMAEASIGYVDYLRLFFWPRDLCVLYAAGIGDPDGWIALSALCVLAAITLVAIALRRQLPGVLMGWLWFALLLSPLMGLVPFGRQSVADRYMYLPQLGLILMSALIGASLLNRFLGARAALAARAAVVLLVAGLALLSWRQSLTWRDSGALWTQAIIVDPGNALAHTNLSGFLNVSGDKRAAEFELRVAGKSWPESIEVQGALGIFLLGERRFEAAGRILDAVISQDATNMKMHTALIRALRGQGREEAANRMFARQEAIRGRIFLNLGLDYLESGDWDAAAEQFKLAWSAADEVEIAMHRRLILRPVEEWRGRAEKAWPGPKTTRAGRANLGGLLLALQNRWPDAAAAFAEFLEANSSDIDSRWRYAVALRRAGDIPAADREFAVAAKAAPEVTEMARSWAAAGAPLNQASAAP